MSDDKPTPHPAKFSDPILTTIASTIMHRYPDLDPEIGVLALDPMAGVGKVHQLRDMVPGLYTWGVELEPEWATQSSFTHQGNALDLCWWTKVWGRPNLIITSPAYGNRMADNYAGDPSNSRRHTYRIDLGRELSVNNTAALQWGANYRTLHRRIWAECVKIIKPDGLIIVNTKDHVRKGVMVPVTKWHWTALKQLGCVMEEVVEVGVPSMRHGQNGDARADVEYVAIFRVSKE